MARHLARVRSKALADQNQEAGDDAGAGWEGDLGVNAAAALNKYYAEYMAKQQSSEVAKDFVQENARAQRSHTTKHIQEKLRLNRAIEDHKLQMARKKK